MYSGDLLEEALEADERFPLSARHFFRNLLRYFAAHKWWLWAIVAACAVETAFYWLVPLAFRYLIDNTLKSAERRSLISVLLLLGLGSALASLASL